MAHSFNRDDGTFAQVGYSDLSGSAVVSLTSVTDATTADISLTSGSSTTFVTGPFVTQGSSGTWFASGAVTFRDAVGTPQVFAKLWDGTTIIGEGGGRITAAGTNLTIALSGVITSPSSNLKISGTSLSSNTVLAFNVTGGSANCVLTAVRIA